MYNYDNNNDNEILLDCKLASVLNIDKGIYIALNVINLIFLLIFIIHRCLQ